MKTAKNNLHKRIVNGLKTSPIEECFLLQKRAERKVLEIKITAIDQCGQINGKFAPSPFNLLNKKKRYKSS